MATIESNATSTPAADATEQTTTQTPTHRRAAVITLVLLSLAVFLTALDQTVVITALVPIAQGIGVNVVSDLPSLAWVVSGYLLGYVIIMPLMGRISDNWGRRRILIGCLVLFAVGSFLCVEAISLANYYPLAWLSVLGINSPNPALTWLVIARFIQAVGGGATVPIAIAAIGDLFGAERRILALGIIGGVTEAGGALGPLYGALIIAKWPLTTANFDQTWEWIFLLNLPLVALIITALLLLWPRHYQAVQEVNAVRIWQIDWIGAALLGGSLLFMSLGLGQAAGIASSLDQLKASQNNPWLLVVAVVLLALFIVFEARQRFPVISLQIFRSRAFSAGALYNLLMGIALITGLVNVTVVLNVAIDNVTPLDVGLALLRMTVMIPIGAFTGGWLVARFGCRPIGAIGAFLTALGFLLMSHWTHNVSWTEVTIGTVITGLGFGLIIAPISTTALNTTTRDRFGMASSIVTALRIIGMILGLAFLSSWELKHYQDLASQVPRITDPTSTAQINAQATAIQQAGIHAATDFFLVGTVLALVAIIPAFFLWKPKAGEKGEVSAFSGGL